MKASEAAYWARAGAEGLEDRYSTFTLVPGTLLAERSRHGLLQTVGHQLTLAGADPFLWSEGEFNFLAQEANWWRFEEADFHEALEVSASKVGAFFKELCLHFKRWMERDLRTGQASSALDWLSQTRADRNMRYLDLLESMCHNSNTPLELLAALLEMES